MARKRRSAKNKAKKLCAWPESNSHHQNGVARAVVEGIAASDENAMIVLCETRTENLQNVPDGNAKYGSTPRVRGVISSDHDAPLHVPSTKKCTASSSCREAPPAKPALNMVVTNPKAPKPAQV